MAVPHRRNFQITIAAGTPVRLASADAPSPVFVQEMFIQSMAGNSGLGLVLDGVPVTTALNSADPAQLEAQLGASPSATQPGGSYGDPPGGAGGWNQSSPKDLREMGLDGTHTGDVFIVSYVLRN